MPFAGHQLMLILGSLISQDRSAMGIIEEVAKATGGRARIPVGSIYTQLERLERPGLIRGRYGSEKPPARGSRPRRYYRLTANGKAALDAVDLVRGMALAKVRS